MITLEIDANFTALNDNPILAALSGIRSQIPYAASVLVNNLANDGQSAVRAALAGEFHLRRKDFVERTIYRDPKRDFATKANLSATVRVNPERDFLGKFEADQTKHSRAGRALAIPIPRLQSPSLIIGRNSPLSVKAVMSLIQQQGGRQVGPFKRRAAKRAQQQAFYLIKSRRTAKTLIIQRTGPGTTRVLYEFVDEVPITSHRLHFVELARAAVLANFDRRADEAIAKAIATMR